ncbi:MAG: flagellar protein FlaG [Alphaproteobacteria bacterium]|nr:flagellar protein FlaG [Alphaproteobacteria bacterium]
MVAEIDTRLAVPRPAPAPRGTGGEERAPEGIAEPRPLAPEPPVALAERQRAQAAESQKAVSPVKSLEDRLNEITHEMLGTNSRLSIEADADTGVFIYRSVDTRSGEVIKQWPPEEVLKLLEFFRLREGDLVDERA